MRSWTCFAETVSLFNGYFKPFVNCPNQLLGQRCGPAIEHAEAAEVVLVDYWMLSKQQDYRRNHVRKCYLMVLDNGTKLFNVELWHHDQREAAVETLAY